jgi:NMD protein affecting ribosome stability and mRNA decay
LILCRDCGAYFSHGRWISPPPGSSFGDVVRELLLGSVKVVHLSPAGKEFIPIPQAQKVQFNIKPDLEKGVVEVEGKGKVHELQIEPKHERLFIRLDVARRTCKICSLKRGGYYEAVIQIRGDVGGRELPKLRKALESLANREAKEFVAEVRLVKGGMDVYVSSLTLGRKMAAFLKKSGAHISESSKLVGQSRNGRRKYRVTILARFPRNT